MVMIGHEAVGVADPVVSFVDVLEGVQKVQAVGVVFEDGLLLIAAGRHMIHCAGVFDAEGAGHDRRIAEKMANVKPQDLTLRVPEISVRGRRGIPSCAPR
jgi:hypothetical protein